MENTSKERHKMIAVRKKKKLTQEQLGEMVGTHRSNIVKIEKGISNPRFELAKKICEALKIKMTDL